jgi:hypothetical protein
VTAWSSSSVKEDSESTMVAAYVMSGLSERRRPVPGREEHIAADRRHGSNCMAGPDATGCG